MRLSGYNRGIGRCCDGRRCTTRRRADWEHHHVAKVQGHNQHDTARYEGGADTTLHHYTSLREADDTAHCHSQAGGDGMRERQPVRRCTTARPRGRRPTQCCPLPLSGGDGGMRGTRRRRPGRDLEVGVSGTGACAWELGLAG